MEIKKTLVSPLFWSILVLVVLFITLLFFYATVNGVGIHTKAIAREFDFDQGVPVETTRTYIGIETEALKENSYKKTTTEWMKLKDESRSKRTHRNIEVLRIKKRIRNSRWRKYILQER